MLEHPGILRFPEFVHVLLASIVESPSAIIANPKQNVFVFPLCCAWAASLAFGGWLGCLVGCLACLWRLARLPLARGFYPSEAFAIHSFIHSFFPISGFAVAFAQRAEGFTGNTSRPQLELLTTSTNYIYTASNTSSDLKDSTPTTTKKMTSPAALFQDKLGESDTHSFYFFLFLFFFFLNTEK